ncbi:CoA-transferase subunit beta [Streptomyces prunicolor]|uniref:CoA-transferase subunit beta n=1 Tax=Streptomyces prunicolor TaxID=67348 RepID=UPI0037D12BD5
MTSAVPPYSMTEQMVCATSRLIRDGEVVYVGVGMPVISALLAKRTHAPDCTIVLETGIVRTAVFPLPALLDTLTTQAGADALSSAGYVNALAQRGRIDLGIIGAGQVDRFGNVNSTAVGPFDAPVLRWPGAGGACEIASLCGRFIVAVNQKRQRFPARVPFVSAPGYLSGGQPARDTAGLRPGTGPANVITDLATYTFPAGAMQLASAHAGVSLDRIAEETAWDVVDPALSYPTTAPPTEEELRILRDEIDPTGIVLRQARRPGSGTTPVAAATAT